MMELMTFNKLFLRELCILTKREPSLALEYIGKSPRNASKFYEYTVLSLEPHIWVKPHVYEALGNAIEKWEGISKGFGTDGFTWGV